MYTSSNIQLLNRSICYNYKAQLVYMPDILPGGVQKLLWIYHFAPWTLSYVTCIPQKHPPQQSGIYIS